MDVRQKVCVVTGASSGIGKEIARGLAEQGARVVLVSRDPGRGRRAVADIGTNVQGPLDVALADLQSMAEVRDLAAELLKRHERIDVLVNNAGGYNLRRHATPDGYERTFAVNHLAPFLLTRLLLDRMREGAPARIVTVASEAHRGATLDLDDLNLQKRYKAWTAYARSKLANIMFTYAIARRLEGSGVTANCLHPGVVSTNLVRAMRLGRLFMRSPAEGADTAVWLASDPALSETSGGYFDEREARRSSEVSYDEGVQEALWEASERLTGLA